MNISATVGTEHINCPLSTVHLLHISEPFRIFAFGLDTFARCKNIQVNLIFLARFFLIFEMNLQDTFARFEKYSSKLDIYRSFFRIFA